MASKKGSKKMTMTQAFNAAQGPAVARPYGKTKGSKPYPPTGTTTSVPAPAKSSSKRSYPKVKKK